MIDPFLIKKTTTVFDAIVVGSGITGGWVTKELCEQGLKVLLLERGRPVRHRQDYPTEGKAPWQLLHRGQVPLQERHAHYPVQQQCYAFNGFTQHFFANDKDHPYQTGEGKPFAWIRGQQLGGKSLLWHRQSYRWSDLDFNANRLDGHGVDWPIRYKDIAPWYSYVERFIGVAGSHERIPQLPDSEFLPAFELNAVEKMAQKKYETCFRDRRLIPGRCAHLSKANSYFHQQGRVQCQARDQCQRGCSYGAYFSTLSSTLPAAIATNNLKIACHSIVEKVMYDSSKNQATGVQVIDEQTLERRSYQGNMIFLCASTLATTQIMLNSVCQSFPGGIANSSGVLGHYLVDHMYNARASGLIPGFTKDYYRGRRPTGTYVPRFRNLDENNRHNFLRGYSLSGNSGRQSWQRATESDTFGVALKTSLREPGPWYFSLYGSGEMLPRFENHVCLDKTKKDKWGMPQLVIHCQYGDNEHNMLKDMLDSAKELLSIIGAEAIEGRITSDPPGLSVHELGTARMGADPQTSVVNLYNQCHDVPNLYVTDGACFASGSWQAPSLTMMAIAARAAHTAAVQYKQQRRPR